MVTAGREVTLLAAVAFLRRVAAFGDLLILDEGRGAVAIAGGTARASFWILAITGVVTLSTKAPLCLGDRFTAALESPSLIIVQDPGRRNRENAQGHPNRA